MTQLRFSRLANTDISEILYHSLIQFGSDAETRYAELLSTAFEDIAQNPNRVGVKSRPELSQGAKTWHLSGSRDHVNAAIGRVMRPRHFVVFRVENDVIQIGRVLHEMMDPALHIDSTTWEMEETLPDQHDISNP